MSNYTEYFCEITGKSFNQKCHIEKHLKTKTFKQQLKIKKLELENLSKDELKTKYGTSNIKIILDKMSCIKKEQIDLSSDSEDESEYDKPNYSSISNKDKMKDMVHSIHNMLRNKGAGYGMNALKRFETQLNANIVTNQLIDFIKI